MVRSLLLLSVGFFLLLTGCTKPEATATSEPADQQVAAETEVVEEVIVVEPAPDSGDPEQPGEGAEAAADEQASVSPRPSLMLSLMLQPANLVMASTMETVQGLTSTLTTGGIPGMPRPAESSDEASVETSEESKESEPDPATP